MFAVLDDFEPLRNKLYLALDTARRCYEESKLAYDSGRYEGIKEAIEQVDLELTRYLLGGNI
jgi:hypothetical protein